MKKLIYLAAFVAVSLTVIQCSPKTANVTPNVEAFLTKEEALKSSVSDLTEGKSLFEEKCSKCHDLRAPETKDAEKWHRTLNKMIPKTKVSEIEGAQIRAYVVANSK